MSNNLPKSVELISGGTKTGLFDAGVHSGVPWSGGGVVVV